jgi:excisionase family DNA binding protein
MTVLRLINRGQLPAVKIGRVWRVRQADVEALLAGTLS